MKSGRTTFRYALRSALLARLGSSMRVPRPPLCVECGRQEQPQKRRSPGPCGPGRAVVRVAELAGERHVRGARPLGALRDLELDLVTLVEGAKTLGLDLGVVDEDVRTTLVREKTETL